MPVTDLSPQQLKIMQYLVDGLIPKEIAEKLGIRQGTVKKYMNRVLIKTGAQTTYQCIAILAVRGVVVVAPDGSEQDT